MNSPLFQSNQFKKFIVSIVLLCVASFAYAQKCTLNFERHETTYIVHLPAGYSKTKQYPLIVNYHGLNADAAKHQHYCQMDKVADKEGFIVVYPQSYHKGWNAGLGFRSYTNGPDDIGYLNLLLDTLEVNYSIDKQRIYTAGVSMGGSFNYRIASEMSNRIAAIASVSGLMTDSTLIYCDPVRNIPILHFHGTHDPLMNYKGMKQAFGAEEVVKLWALKDQCSNKPDTIQIPDRCKSDKTTVLLVKYTNCSNKSEVWFYKINGGGHTWPGSAKAFKFLGRKNKDINGSEAIWEFFQKFTLQTGVSMHSKVEK